MSSFQIYGEWWEFDYYVTPEQDGREGQLELTEVYRYEGQHRVIYGGDYNEHELTALAYKALDDDREY